MDATKLYRQLHAPASLRLRAVSTIQISTLYRRGMRALLLGAITSALAACGGGTEGSPVTGGGSEPSGGQAVTITWRAPNSNQDGSCLTDLAGYQLSYGLSSSAYTHDVSVDDNEAVCEDIGENSCGTLQRCSATVTIGNGEAANWYLAMRAYDFDSNFSAYSNEVMIELSGSNSSGS